MQDVLVIIVSYKSSADVARCLEALARSNHTMFRVAVCENGGYEAYIDLTQLLPAVLNNGQPVEILLAPRNLGYAGGINLVLDSSPSADAYWILNPDAVPDKKALSLLLSRLAVGDCGAVSHDILWSSGELASRGGRWHPVTAQAVAIGMRSEVREDTPSQPVEAEMNYIVGASMFFSHQFVTRVGQMREDYFLYCEEVEWCLRAVKLGERLAYAPGAQVVHWHGTSTGGGGELAGRSRTSVYLNERARILLTRDLYPSLLWMTAPIALASCVLRYGRRRAWRQIFYAAQGWLAGVRNERGAPAWILGSPTDVAAASIGD